MENIKELFLPFTKKEWRLRMLLVGLLFVAVAFPCKTLLTLIPGATEIRPANTIPVVFGLLWGPAGAWGIAVAEALTDIFSGYPAIEWIPGSVMNFFYAWLPYKLWYSLASGGQGVKEPRLRSVRDILRFIRVVFLTSVVTTTLIALLFEYMGIASYGQSAMLLFFNNFDFAVVLGIPLILLLTSRETVSFWTPAEGSCGQDHMDQECSAPAKKKGNFRGIATDALLLGINFFGILYFFASRFLGVRLPSRGVAILLAAFLLFEILYIFRPYAPRDHTVPTVHIRSFSIRARVVLGYLLVMVFSVLLVGIAVDHALESAPISMEQQWEYIFLVVGIALNVMFVVLLPFLHYIEKYITGPVEYLVEQVNAFAGRDHYADAQQNLQMDKIMEKINTGDEIEALSESFARMMGDITSYVRNLVTVTAEKERIGAELNVAAQIQADMLPRIFPPYPEKKEFDLYATMDPAKEVGGDFYDFFMVDDDHLGMVMADVSGKGVPAALFMVIARTLIKNRAQMGGSPAEILRDVNEQLCQGNDAELFVTVWLGILELSTGKGMAANAGHEHPVLKRADGEFELVKYRHSPAVAVMEGIRFREHAFEMYPGDTLYVYTDGVTEATDASNRLYGTDRMLEVLNRNQDADMQNLLAEVSKDIELFVGEAPQFDDITMLGMIYYGAGGGGESRSAAETEPDGGTGKE